MIRNEHKDIEKMKREINLGEIFTEQEMKNFLLDNETKPKNRKSTATLPNQLIGNVTIVNKPKSPTLSSKKVNSFLFDRTKFIIKLLRMSKEKLTQAKEKTLVKGIEWLSREIDDSMLFKSDDLTIKKLEQLKKENKEMQNIFNWLEEYSTIKIKQKEGLVKKKLPEITGDVIPLTVVKKYLKSGMDVTNDGEECGTYTTPRNGSPDKFISFSEECISKIESPLFDIFNLEKEVGAENTLSVVSCYIFTTMGLYSLIKYDKFETFIQLIAKGYKRDIPYHNDLHAADVLQSCMLYLKRGQIKERLQLDDIDQCALLISTIIHDYKHPGVTNGFLVNTGHQIAIKFNDISVLENYHVSESFKLLKSNENTNIFSDLTKEEYKVMRKRIVECVLATDMIYHAKQFSFLKLKIENLQISKGSNVDKLFIGHESTNAKFSLQQEFLNIVVHTCDISNPTKPFHIYTRWVDKVMDEFWNQGDKEKEMRLPVSFLCDRLTVTKPSAQLGFIDGIVLPFVSAFNEFFPSLGFLVEYINENKVEWKKLKEQEEKAKEDVSLGKV